ncbi:MAG TPA: TlpA disulfide reductase family protein [Alphaproteobacteria bacterium]|jgi:thiol-disulfide isomerase/thioredoxin|nr:TlpA disulfide reductase family protein [Alphaproteobacteria bacterium]
MPQHCQRGRATFVFLWTIVAALVLCCASPAVADDRPLPDCAVKLDAGGGFEQFRGKVLYVDFWASWCGPCLLSFPFMNDLQSAYGPRGLQVVAVDMDEKPADAAAFLAKHPVGFAVAAGPNAPCATAFGVATMPTSFLVDRNGRIRSAHAGFKPGDVDGLRAEVESLLAEKSGS